MDDIRDILPLIVFFAIWMLGKFFTSGAEERVEDEEAAERTRQIQEEIRRRIQERLHGGDPRPLEGPVVPGQPPEPEQPRAASTATATPTAAERRAAGSAQTEPTTTSSAAPATTRTTRAREQTEARQSTKPSAGGEGQLARQRRLLKEAEEQRRRVMEVIAARSATPPSAGVAGAASIGGRSFKAAKTARLAKPAKLAGARAETAGAVRSDLVHQLADPTGVRKAFLFAEILGTPVGLRERGAVARPLWES